MANKYFGFLQLKDFAKDPHTFGQAMKAVPSICSAYRFSRAFKNGASRNNVPISAPVNPLWDYFRDYKEGPGIWKWEHYFDVYHRHLAKFVGQKVSLLEVGIYSGGSLEMWRSYFGKDSRVYGVDIEEACKAYERDHVSVFIGDQADRGFGESSRAV